jgi:hypothetical protein
LTEDEITALNNLSTPPVTFVTAYTAEPQNVSTRRYGDQWS